MTCPPCASFFRRQIFHRSLLLSCVLALSVVTAIATVSGLATGARALALRAVTKKAAALLPAPGATATFNINANGAKEVTSMGTPNQGDVDGTAVGTITFDNGTGSGSTGSATINLTLTNLDVGTIDLTGHHIHQAPSTTTGAIVIDFGDPDFIRSGNTLSGTITGLPAATITSLLANPSGFYYNLHNAQFTGGAVRDQFSDAQTGPTLTVNSTADPGDGSCTIGNCTLREAISVANAAPGAETINFDPTVFGSAQTITLGSALPDISTDVTIGGSGAALLTVSGNDAVRVFNVLFGATVTIQDLTIRDGNAVGGDGGGIKNAGTLTLANAAITSSAASNGGGAYNSGSLTTINSTFSDNSSIGSGGGAYNGGSLIATNSTFSGNSSGSSGGGVSNLGSLIVTNSTLSGNSATSNGGGISNFNTTRLRNTIVANSTTGGDCSGLVTAFNSLVEDGTCGVTNGVNGNRTGVDPLLGTLTGSPAYFPLQAYSPARNAGNNFFVSEADDDGAGSADSAIDYNGDGDQTDALTTDQAGASRIANTIVDMGSTELRVIVVDRTDNVTTAGTGNCTDTANDCTLRGAINVANSNADTSIIIFDATVFATPRTITITNGLPIITTSMNIVGTGEAMLTLSGSGGTTRLFQIEPGTTVSLEAMTLSGSSTNNGAALFNNGSTVTVSHVTCSGNTALNTSSGGALYNSASGTLKVDYATFMGNTSGGSGGAIHIQSGSVFVSNSTFINNTSNATNSATGGGAIYNNSGSSLRVINSSFVGNNVPNGGYGGALFAANSPMVITNSTFSGNTATTGGGGGISTTSPGAVVTITNSTFSGNAAAAGLGGGIRRGSASTLTLRNTIVANSTSGGDCSTFSTAPSFANSLVEDGTCGVVNGINGNKTGDPALDVLTNGYFPLTSGSPARDAGNNNFLSEATTGVDYNGDGDTNDTLTTDQAGGSRIFNTTVDMGATEFILRDFVVDRTDDALVDDCTAAANDCTLRGAITTANAANGTDTITFDATVFAGAQTITLGSALPNITTPMTIDGSGTGGVTISGADIHRPFFIQSATATLQDLTIRDGLASGGQGGAVHVAGTSGVTLRRVTVTSSTANFGGGIYNNSGNTLFVFDSTIIDNDANNNGGGILNSGVMYMLNSAVLDNGANSQGGGILSTSSANLTNVTVTGNTANTTAGMYFSNGTSTLTNVTVSGNTASNQVGGVQRFSGTVIVRNSIFANNTGTDCYNSMTVVNSLVRTQDGTFPCGVTNGVNGNIVGQDPLLGTRTNGYFPLTVGSPAIDKGNNFFVSEADDDGAGSADSAIDFNGDGDQTDTLTTDQAGANRIANTIVDMGATESPDIVPPTVSSIVRASANPTNPNTSVSFTVTFTEPVTGVDAADFVLTAASGGPFYGASVTGVTGTGDTRTVTVNTGTGTGLLRLDVTDDDTIADAPNNKLGGTGAGNGNFTGGEAYTVNSVDTVSSLVVTKTDDTNDGACDADCSLREAISVANADPGAETITFDPSVFTSPGPHIIQLASALPDLSSDMTIGGPGARVLTVRRDTGGNYRIFTVQSGVTVNINGLTMTNGRAADGANGDPPQNGNHGGGILNSGTLTLTGVAVVGNRAGNGGDSTAASGGIGGQGGPGGGIYNSGTLNVTNSTVSGNQAGNGGGGNPGAGGPGGGIANTGTLTITNSTISGNQTGAGAGSAVGGDGGGISSFGTVTLASSTITANFIGGTGSTSGGGVLCVGACNITVRNTIIAGNTAASGPDFSGNATSQGFNLIGNNSGSGFSSGTPNMDNDIVGTAGSPVDPQLGILTNNGGQTDTHALSSTSPAVDAGDDNSASPTTDQRGVTRPFDIAPITNATNGDGSDIGAFELQNSTPVAVAPTPAPSTNEDTAVVITLTGTDADDHNLTFTITDATDNGSLVPLAAPDCSATNSCTATFTYTPNADYFGGDSFKFKVNDGTVDSTEETVSITINSVNDVPSFTKGADQTVFNSAPQTITNWATNLSAGPANEAEQTPDFIVTNDNNALFAAQPSIDPSGTLTFTPALGMSGTATVSVQIHDNGGTANSGQDTSAVQTFVITVNLTGWTTSGANGATEDESNPQRPTYTNFTAAANPGSPAGTYVLRYNITAMGNLTLPGAVSTRLRVRFRDDGAGSQVTIAIVQSPITGGATTLGTIFDSDAYIPGSGFQTQEIVMPPIVFDFTQNTYWLEVRLVKAGELNQPGVGSVQLNQQ